MAGYYTYIVAGLDTSSAAPVRWSHTDDVLTSQPLMAACLPALDRTKGGWCIEEEEGTHLQPLIRVFVCMSCDPDPIQLFGVMCVDVNEDRLLASNGGVAMKATLDATTATCPSLSSLTEADLEVCVLEPSVAIARV